MSIIRKDFPILETTLHPEGQENPVPLVYLDNAATTQKPSRVIKAVENYYRSYNSNVHRALHTLGEKATSEYEKARSRIKDFIGAENTSEIIFTRNTTESINLVASSWGGKNVKKGDEILLSEMEHHSNIIPWQLLSERTGSILKFIPFTRNGKLDMEAFFKLLSDRTVFVGIIHVSNVFGTFNDVETIIKEAHKRSIPVLVDGAQSIPHIKINVKDLDCDFFVFSGHKLYGPMGTGILYGKEKILEDMPPFMGGGEMIRSVKLSGSTWNELPWKFEAGTPNVPGAIGLAEAVNYIDEIGIDRITEIESELTEYAFRRFEELDNITLYGPLGKRAGVFPFTHSYIHPHDMAQFLDYHGIAIRAGHHCAQPLMRKLGVSSTSRASLAFYNTKEEIDFLIEKIDAAGEYFSYGI